jgi:pimeloyl-ACP methyl ester carboxylesterase
MPVAAVNGTELFYGDVGAGPPIVFLHGAAFDSSTWAGQVERLSPQFRCIAYDRRGSSRSPYVADVSLEGEVDTDDAAALIRLLGATACILVASSAGGRVALDLLLRHPGLVRGAVLGEPAVFELDPDEGAAFQAAARSAVHRAFADRGPRAAVDAFAELVDPADWRSAGEEERNRRRDNHPALLRLIEGWPAPLTAERLEELDTPCVVVMGSRTLPVFRGVATVVAGAIPGARLVEIAGAGHQTYLHDPDTFAGIVIDFAAALGFRPQGTVKTLASSSRDVIPSF